MKGVLRKKKFSEINLEDSFFDSLKNDYPEFSSWFLKKRLEDCFIHIDESNSLDGFLYLKKEKGPIKETSFVIDKSKVLKIGTFKIKPHKTKLGERFIKTAFDFAIENNIEAVYLTVYPKHSSLVNLLKKYGFVEYTFKKNTFGKEIVLLKNFDVINDNVLFDYPLIKTKNMNKYLLSIYPKFHSRMFPDSILDNESVDILSDVSHTNSIHKIYITSMSKVQSFNKGDIIIIYRTADDKGPAEYRSVATSLCVIEEVKNIDEFVSPESFLNYSKKYSIFTENELFDCYKKYKYLIKMTYNTSFKRRVIRRSLIEDVGLQRNEYFGVYKLNNREFDTILKLGDVNERFIIH